MGFNPDIHHRRSIRLPDYDYTQPGHYYITICTYQREPLFGDIIDGIMQPNEIGALVIENWQLLAEHHSHVQLSAFVLMPNHIHGILTLLQNEVILESDKPDATHRKSLSDIIRDFKSFSAKVINKTRQTPGIPVWQRNFYEHIIQDEKSYFAINNYIVNNPINWKLDDLYSEQ